MQSFLNPIGPTAPTREHMGMWMNTDQGVWEGPSLPSAWVGAWLKKTHDLVLVLGADAVVSDVIRNASFSAPDLQAWVGLTLSQLLASDSLCKVDALWSNDASSTQSDARWRHLNLIDPGGSELPVQALCMGLPGGSQRLLLCRDLRPAVEATRLQQQAFRELQGTIESVGLTRPGQSLLS